MRKTPAEEREILAKHGMSCPEWGIFASANYWPTQGLPEQHVLDMAVCDSEGDPLGEITLQQAQSALQSLYERKLLRLKNGWVRPSRKGRKAFLRLRHDLFPDRFP